MATKRTEAGNPDLSVLRSQHVNMPSGPLKTNMRVVGDVKNLPEKSIYTPHARQPGVHKQYAGPERERGKIGPGRGKTFGKNPEHPELPVVPKSGSYVNPANATRGQKAQSKYKGFSKGRVQAQFTPSYVASKTTEGRKIQGAAALEKHEGAISKVNKDIAGWGKPPRRMPITSKEGQAAAKGTPVPAPVKPPFSPPGAPSPAPKPATIDLVKQSAERKAARTETKAARAPKSKPAVQAAPAGLEHKPENIRTTRQGASAPLTEHLQPTQFGGKHHGPSAASAVKNAYGSMSAPSMGKRSKENVGGYAGKHRGTYNEAYDAHKTALVGSVAYGKHAAEYHKMTAPKEYTGKHRGSFSESHDTMVGSVKTSPLGKHAK